MIGYIAIVGAVYLIVVVGWYRDRVDIRADRERCRAERAARRAHRELFER